LSTATSDPPPVRGGARRGEGRLSSTSPHVAAIVWPASRATFNPAVALRAAHRSTFSFGAVAGPRALADPVRRVIMEGAVSAACPPGRAPWCWRCSWPPAALVAWADRPRRGRTAWRRLRRAAGRERDRRWGPRRRFGRPPSEVLGDEVARAHPDVNCGGRASTGTDLCAATGTGWSGATGRRPRFAAAASGGPVPASG
jgi:hypothetical protein